MHDVAIIRQRDKLAALSKYPPNQLVEITLGDYVKLLTVSHIVCKMCADGTVPPSYAQEICLTIEDA
jgi:hypothetical protein